MMRFQSENAVIRDVHAKIFQAIDFFFNFHSSQIMSYMCQKCKKIEGHQLHFRDNAFGKLP